MAHGLRQVSWRSILVVGITAVATFVAIDATLWRVAPPVRLREVEDAVAEYAKADPTILAVGSSHARTFAVLGQDLAALTQGAQRTVAVPVEAGKLTSYQWVLEHRLRPLIEERTPDGSPRRPSLARAVLITEWWDSCRPDQPSTNIPSRAWVLPDFLADVARNGLTSYNRNYLATRWRRLWSASALVQDRGHGDIARGLRARLVPSDPGRSSREARLVQTQRLTEDGRHCIADSVEMRALDAMIDYLQRRGLEVTVVLFPRMPGVLTEEAKRTTLRRFSAIMRDVAAGHGVRLVDLTLTSPLRDDDFHDDMDHVTVTGSHKFAQWALDGDLHFLTEPPVSASLGGSAARRP